MLQTLLVARRDFGYGVGTAGATPLYPLGRTAPLLTFPVHLAHRRRVARGAKRVLDVVLATGALIALTPLLMLIAAAVKISSPGPVLFKQVRLGADGRRFVILKFRSMRSDAEQLLKASVELSRRHRESGYKLAAHVDPRITSVGRWIRSTSLDELPQLWNIVRGDMSVVGPRPIVPQELAEYGHRSRAYLGVRPGLTGYWQVNGRSEVEYPERAEMDETYTRHWSLRLDLAIILRTVPAVLRRRGAY